MTEPARTVASPPWPWGGLGAGTLALAWPYFKVPYAKLSAESLWGPSLLVVALAALLARALGRQGWWRCVWWCGAAVPLVVMARVVADVWRDSTAHNLWPFELVLAGGIGLLVAGSGALVGSLPSLLSRAVGGNE